MKSLLLAGALFLAALTTQSFANDVKVTHAVMQSFKSTFTNASNVQWSVVERMYKAEFIVDGEKTAAFFDIEDGSLVATARYITINDLPRALRSSLKSQAASAVISEIFEVQSDEGIDYFATLLQDGKTVVLKSAATKWSVYKKN
jgi:hypothetical protein